MTCTQKKRIKLLAVCSLFAAACSTTPPVSVPATTEMKSAATSPATAEPVKPGYNAKGELLRPVGYREWIYVGTPITPNDLNPPAAAFPEFHNVYIHPGDYAHYKQTGKFRDGTVIVKELVSVGTKQATSGKGYFQGDFIGLETLVKDSQRFAKEPGNWAFFSFGHKYPLAEATTAQPAASCNVCHQANADTDYVFTQYYPVLRAAHTK
jgi:Cytochrome P460